MFSFIKKNQYLLLLLFLPLFFTACDDQEDHDDDDQEEAIEQKWTWTEERFNEAVNQVRAGRDLTPDSWPNNSRVAVLLSFDVDNETVAWWDGEPASQIFLVENMAPGLL
jgi:hypothetical protein